ncbi:MAG: sigma-70 family RNA polymerase sigma factor [Deltaproteobacteria bacterium]|nr:sigma-70 family RNA polymerase sigma factor [Deltaproteobacteria bacterium]
MAEGMADLDLIEALRAGQEKGFELLIERYAEKAYGLAVRLTRSPEDAEEVLQDVFVTVFRKINGFEGKSSFSSWLYRVTVNAGLMKIRKRRQDQSVALEDVISGVENPQILKTCEDHDASNLAARKEMLLALSKAISKLPDEYRPVFVLRDVDGLTSREVAEILHISVPAVKSRLHRSRFMLKRRLHAFWGDGRSDGAGEDSERLKDVV